jgi:hypothetical protein
MYNKSMYTVIESAVYLKQSSQFWSDAERETFVLWIGDNPEAGDVMQGTHGLRKVRFARSGMGKRGGGSGDLHAAKRSRANCAFGGLHQGCARFAFKCFFGSTF